MVWNNANEPSRQQTSEVRYGRNCIVHPTSVIGYVPVGASSIAVSFGDEVEIGAFCVVESGASIGRRVKLTHHSVIAEGAVIGDECLVVDSVRVDRLARIGRECVIGGNVPDRTIIGDYVTFMGEMSHSYSDASLPWEGIDEISPIIESGCVISQGAEIIGGVRIGSGSYIASGEIVRTDVPPGVLVAQGRMRPIDSLRGLIKARRVPE